VVSNIPVLAERNGDTDIQKQAFQKGELFLDTISSCSVIVSCVKKPIIVENLRKYSILS